MKHCFISHREQETSSQYLPSDFIKSYMCFTLTTDFPTVWISWSCFLLFSGPPFFGMALKWKHYQNQVHTQLSPCADPYSGNALTLRPSLAQIIHLKHSKLFENLQIGSLMNVCIDSHTCLVMFGCVLTVPGTSYVAWLILALIIITQGWVTSFKWTVWTLTLN